VRIRSASAFVAVLLVTGCSRAKDAPGAAEHTSMAPPATMAARPAAQEDRQPGAPAAQPAGFVAAPIPRANLASLKLIRTGQVSLEVKSTPAAVEAIQKLAVELGGYVAESRAVRQDGDRQAGSLTVRVPAERFAQAVSGLKSLGKVVNESTSTQDVTKAYTDLETRLRVKREAAARVQEILKTRTARLSDVLEAERELARLTEEIEQMEGERRFYDQQIAMSTIAVEVHEPAPVLASSKLAPIGEALSASLEVLAGSVAALIFAVVALVPWLLVALVLWRVIQWARRRRKPAPPPAA
jgi:hypothetical protein